MHCRPTPQERCASAGNYQSFDASSSVRQGSPISPFLFNFVMDEVMRTALAEHEAVGVDLVMGERLCDLEYADDVVCLFDTAESAQLISDRLAKAVIPFGMCFAPSKCKVMYQDWDSPEPPLTLNGVRLDVVDHFTNPGSCLSKDGSIGSEIIARISKARMAFTNLLHLWRKNDISLPVKVACTMPRFVPFCTGVKHGHFTNKMCTASKYLIITACDSWLRSDVVTE